MDTECLVYPFDWVCLKDTVVFTRWVGCFRHCTTDQALTRIDRTRWFPRTSFPQFSLFGWSCYWCWI